MNKIIYNYSYIFILLLFLIFHNSILFFAGNISSMFRYNNKSKLDIKALEYRVNNLKEEISKYERNSNLNISLDKSLVLAKVSLRDIYKFFNYLTINTSYHVGNKKAVINEDGLVGVTSNASLKSANVNLITGNNKISVKVNNSYGLLGEYNRKTKLFKITNISNMDNINKGDTIYTSGLDKIPGNIYVGFVSKVKYNEGNRIIYASSKVNFDELNYLYVLN